MNKRAREKREGVEEDEERKIEVENREINKKDKGNEVQVYFELYCIISSIHPFLKPLSYVGCRDK